MRNYQARGKIRSQSVAEFSSLNRNKVETIKQKLAYLNAGIDGEIFVDPPS